MFNGLLIGMIGNLIMGLTSIAATAVGKRLPVTERLAATLEQIRNVDMGYREDCRCCPTGIV